MARKTYEEQLAEEMARSQAESLTWSPTEHKPSGLGPGIPLPGDGTAENYLARKNAARPARFDWFPFKVLVGVCFPPLGVLMLLLWGLQGLEERREYRREMLTLARRDA